MHNSLNRIAYLAWACLALFAALTAHSAEPTPTQDPVEAVWRAQRLTFEYRSQGRVYSCDILENKIKMILHELGASDRLQLRRTRCQDLAGRAQLEVIMESPVVATAENIRDITQYDSEDELIARVRGVPLPSPTDLERFPAVWQTISFRGPGKLSFMMDGDCALVQQLRHQILPSMSVEVIRDIGRLDCSNSSPRLKVLALVAAGPPAH